jgi:uncharacterized membrane protein
VSDLETRSERLSSVDLVRGAVMVLMAIDHVRVYSGLPAGGPTPGIFFTRWITHFCAPAFVFLAGTGAFLRLSRGGDAAGLSRFLLTRGLWLVFLELTVVRLCWTFSLSGGSYLAGVIWVIGWCMVLMAGLARLRVELVGALGLLILLGHNLLDVLVPQPWETLGKSAQGPLFQVLYYGGPIPLGGDGRVLFILYSLVPWVGVMAAGFGFGRILLLEPPRRHRLCLAIGLGATALFVLLRAFNLYGDPRPWGGPDSRLAPLLSFLNTTKYPASLQFLLMTLGPTLALLPLLERARGPLARALLTFGRVPFFYYLLHIPAIHLAALAVSKVRLGEVSPWLFAAHPAMVPPAPPGYTWSLPLLYAVTALVVAGLYVPCRWFADLKARRRDPWLSFL